SAEEFEKCDPAGKWALCLDAGAEVRVLRGRARQAKAVGLIVAPGADYAGPAYADKYAQDPDRVRVSWPSSKPKSPDKDAVAETMMTRTALLKLLKVAKKSEAAPEGGTVLGVTVSETRRLAGDVMVEDVCGYWPGDDPALSKETILVSAHYDHIGITHGVV